MLWREWKVRKLYVARCVKVVRKTWQLCFLYVCSSVMPHPSVRWSYKIQIVLPSYRTVLVNISRLISPRDMSKQMKQLSKCENATFGIGSCVLQWIQNVANNHGSFYWCKEPFPISTSYHITATIVTQSCSDIWYCNKSNMLNTNLYTV